MSLECGLAKNENDGNIFQDFSKKTHLLDICSITLLWEYLRVA